MGIMVSQAAKILQCHPETVRRLSRKGILPAKRDYRGFRVFDPAEVHRLKAAREKLHGK